MITQSATVDVKASTLEEWDELKAKLPKVILPEGATIFYDDLLRIATITVPSTEVKF